MREQRISEDGYWGGGGQKAHTKLRVPMHSSPLPTLLTVISKTWRRGGLFLGVGELGGLLFQNSFLGQKHRILGATGDFWTRGN